MYDKVQIKIIYKFFKLELKHVVVLKRLERYKFKSQQVSQ